MIWVGLMLATATVMAGPSLVFDPATGEVLSQERAGEPWYPASLTKLMTAYVIFHKLKAAELKLDQKIPVSALAASQPPSKLGMKVGSTLTVDLALQTMLVYSANDRAIRDVYVDGRRVVKAGEIVDFDIADDIELLRRAQGEAIADAPRNDWAGRRLDQLSPRVFPIRE